MMIQAITPEMVALQATTKTEKPSEGSVFDVFMGTVENMSTQQTKAKWQMADVLAGHSDNTHGALIEMEKADLQMNLAAVVRDKTTQAYNQIINMQI